MVRYKEVLTDRSFDGVPCYRIALVREEGVPATAEKRVLVQDAEAVARLCADMEALPHEEFNALFLNTKNGLIARTTVSVGSLSGSIVHPREVFKGALAANAASVVLVHNHPSGDPTPSGADIQLTRRLVKAGDVLGIEVLDHVVIGSEGHRSLRGDGLM